MKNSKLSLALGFGLGLLACLLMGQNRAPAAGPTMRFMMMPASVGVCVIDTTTGAVKVIPTDPRNVATAKMEFGQAFNP